MKTIFLTSTDYDLLSALVTELPSKFKEELKSAVVFHPSAIPPNTVTLNSGVELLDLKSGEVEKWIVTMPEHADILENRISILAPIGMAILGYAEGDEIEWDTPGGIRKLRIAKVKHRAFSVPIPSLPLYSFT